MYNTININNSHPKIHSDVKKAYEDMRFKIEIEFLNLQGV